MKKNCFALVSLIWVLFFNSQVLPANAETQKPDQKPFSAYWQDIASSNLIIRGRFAQSHSKHLKDKSQKSLTIIPLETLKGMEKKQIEIEQTIELNGISERFGNMEVIAFLVHIQNERTDGFYLVDSSPTSVLPLNELQLNLVRKEILNQKLINENYPNLSISKPEKLDITVKQLLNGLVNSDTQEDCWMKLLNMDSKAIPALIRAMNDKRALRPGDFNSFSRKRKSFFYDDHFHYSPQVVQDAVSILLNQLTRISFHTTMNGGTAEERKLDLSGWRAWLYYNKQL
ncbi:hypothetical protein KA183_03990 [bacterium]|nr:hypothetical protein [bacterium]